jgi:DNA-binding CsgD family transcriptional regulator
LAGGDGHGNTLCYNGCDVMGQVRLGEPVEHFEMKSRTKGGRAVWLDVSILEAPATNGNRPVAVHLFRDITATKKLLEIVQERMASAAPSNGNGASGLTKREIEILRLMAAGANTKVLAERLHVSGHGRNHAQNIFGKLRRPQPAPRPSRGPTSTLGPGRASELPSGRRARHGGCRRPMPVPGSGDGRPSGYTDAAYCGGRCGRQVPAPETFLRVCGSPSTSAARASGERGRGEPGRVSAPTPREGK